VLLTIAFAVGFYNFPLTTIGLEADHLPGDPGDNRLNNYILEHGYRYLRGLETSFWDAPMLYPRAGATRTSDAHLGMLPVYTAFRVAGLSPESAFQGYFLVPFALNFAAAAWAMRRLGFGPTAAAVCAYLFAYGLPVAAQIPHAQLFPRFLVPPAFALGWEHLRDPRAWKAWAVAGCAAGQFYLSVYIGAMLVAVLAAGFAVGAVVLRGEIAWGRLARPGAVAAVAGCAAAVVPLLSAHSNGTGTPTNAIRSLAPYCGSWLAAPAYASTFPDLAGLTGLDAGHGMEQQLRPGLLALLALPVGLAAAFGRRTNDAAVLATAAWVVVLVAVVVTQWQELWPYELLVRLPGVSGLRAVGRVVLVLLFPAGVVLGGCAGAVVTAAGRRGRLAAAAVAVLAVAAVAADNRLVPPDGPGAARWGSARSPKADALRRQDAIAAAIRAHPAPRVLYVFPSYGAGNPLGHFGVQCEAMRAAQDAGVVCVNGWTGYLPPGWDFFRGYRGLFRWLVGTGVPPEEFAGLVLVGEPEPDYDPIYDAVMRAAMPSYRP
jgi:hypothetical protein